MLELTESAMAEFERFNEDELVEGEFIRIKRAYQCGGPSFEITVDDARTAMDHAVEYSGFQLVIEETCMTLLEKCQLDFNENGFVFNDELGKRC